MTPNVFQIVSASTVCRQLLGAPPKMRFVEFGEAVQGDDKIAYAVWQLISGLPAKYLGQMPDNDETRIQVDVYASQQLVARAAAIAIRDAIEPHAHMVSFAQRQRDATTRSYGYLMDFQFFTDREDTESS
jgi:hypothetical protein